MCQESLNDPLLSQITQIFQVIIVPYSTQWHTIPGHYKFFLKQSNELTTR